MSQRHVVLVRSLYARNVGASSRAMANMGFEQLVLIAPQCQVDYEAQQAAATGQQALQSRLVFPSWEAYHEAFPEFVRYGFTARDGQNRILQDVRQVWLSEPQGYAFSQDVALVFGPEDWGLSNEDLSHCHFAVSLPTFGKNPSLNLAQAVLLALYTWQTQASSVAAKAVTPYSYRQRKGDSDFVVIDNELESPTGAVPLWFPDTSFRKFLQALNFDLEDRRVSVYSSLRAYFLRAIPTYKEKRLLQNIFEQAARKISARD